jgi:hypothetical protein
MCTFVSLYVCITLLDALRERLLNGDCGDVIHVYVCMNVIFIIFFKTILPYYSVIIRKHLECTFNGDIDSERNNGSILI